MITICQPRLRDMDEPVAELAAYFGSKSRLPDQDLVRLTAAARAAGSRWEAIAAACGIHAYEDLAGAVCRITGETGADLLFSATQYAVEQLTGSQRRYPPLTWACPQCSRQVADRAASGRPSTSNMATPRAAPGWPATKPPTTNAAGNRSPG
jgi:hypothetical protein